MFSFVDLVRGIRLVGRVCRDLQFVVGFWKTIVPLCGLCRGGFYFNYFARVSRGLLLPIDDDPPSLPAFYREILFEIRRAHAIRSYVLSHTADRSTSKIVRDSAARSILEDAFSRVGVNQEVVTEVQRKVLEEKLSVEEVSRTSTKSLVHLLPLIGAGASGGAGGVADGGGIERRGGMEQKRRAIVSQVVLGKKWREQVPRGG